MCVLATSVVLSTMRRCQRTAIRRTPRPCRTWRGSSPECRQSRKSSPHESRPADSSPTCARFGVREPHQFPESRDCRRRRRRRKMYASVSPEFTPWMIRVQRSIRHTPNPSSSESVHHGEVHFSHSPSSTASVTIAVSTWEPARGGPGNAAAAVRPRGSTATARGGSLARPGRARAATPAGAWCSRRAAE